MRLLLYSIILASFLFPYQKNGGTNYHTAPTYEIDSLPERELQIISDSLLKTKIAAVVDTGCDHGHICCYADCLCCPTLTKKRDGELFVKKDVEFLGGFVRLLLKDFTCL